MILRLICSNPVIARSWNLMLESSSTYEKQIFAVIFIHIKLFTVIFSFTINLRYNSTINLIRVLWLRRFFRFLILSIFFILCFNYEWKFMFKIAKYSWTKSFQWTLIFLFFTCIFLIFNILQKKEFLNKIFIKKNSW